MRDRIGAPAAVNCRNVRYPIYLTYFLPERRLEKKKRTIENSRKKEQAAQELGKNKNVGIVPPPLVRFAGQGISSPICYSRIFEVTD